MPWSGKEDVERHNKKCAQYAACRNLWLKTANDCYKRTGDDGQAVLRANVAAKKWLQSHGKYRRNADTLLQQLRRNYNLEPTFTNAMKLAGALLRTASIDHFRQLAIAGDVEALELIRYMRAQLLGEDTFSKIENVPDNPRFFADARRPGEHPYVTKYVNIYCNQTPYASVTVYMVDDAIRVVQLLRELYSSQDLPPPPEPVEISSSMIRILGKKVMSVGVYPGYTCQIKIGLEDEPCFIFEREDALPILIKRGRRNTQLRSLTEEDVISDERGTFYKQLSYEDLPDFAKPTDQRGVPNYVVANLVTRGQVSDIDGPAWQNFYEPMAKIYIGYLVNYLLTSPSGWEWGNDTSYTYICQHTEEAAQAFRNSLDIQEGVNVVELPGRLLQRLDACPLAGIPQFLEERPSRSRCRQCGNDVTIEIHQSRQLLLREDAPLGTPSPPAYVNQMIDLLQRLYQDEVHGDINSVLGGQDLSVSLSEGSYGPIED